MRYPKIVRAGHNFCQFNFEKKIICLIKAVGAQANFCQKQFTPEQPSKWLHR